MSLFNKVSNSSVHRQQDTSLSPAEAFAAIALVAVATDGYVSNEETVTVRATLEKMHLFRSYPSEVVIRMFNRLGLLLQRMGINGFLGMALEYLPHDLYETVFAVVTDIVLADGEVTQEEEKLLNSLYRALSIPESTAIKIIDVMIIKNKG